MKDLEIKKDSKYYLYGEYIRHLDKILLEEEGETSVVVPATSRRVAESEEAITVRCGYSTESEETNVKIRSHKKYSILQKVSKYW